MAVILAPRTVHCLGSSIQTMFRPIIDQTGELGSSYLSTHPREARRVGALGRLMILDC